VDDEIRYCGYDDLDQREDGVEFSQICAFPIMGS